MRRLALCVLAACACEPARPASVSIAPPPPARTAPPVPVASAPEPRIAVATDGAYESWTWSKTGLPAISPDGGSVAYAYARDDGGRGFPNLYVGVVPVGGDREQTTTIFTSEEVSAGAPGLAMQVHERVALANGRLRGWSPMTTEVIEDRVADAPQVVSVAGLEWTYSEPKLVVRARGREVLARTLSDGPASSEPCTYTSRLYLAAVDPAHRVALVAIRYSAPPDWCADDDVYRAFRYGSPD